jgi:hypothetical protein
LIFYDKKKKLKKKSLVKNDYSDKLSIINTVLENNTNHIL